MPPSESGRDGAGCPASPAARCRRTGRRRSGAGGSAAAWRSRSCRRLRARPRTGPGSPPRWRPARRPSAVTSSAASRLSIVMPYLRASQPIPPPRVIPAAPTEPVSPNGTARPWAYAARVSSPATTPASTQAVRRTGSMSMPFIADRSISSTPSPVLWPAALWPPARTARRKPRTRPNTMAVATSAASTGLAIRAGRRSTAPLATRRACSNSGSAGPSISAPEPGDGRCRCFDARVNGRVHARTVQPRAHPPSSPLSRGSPHAKDARTGCGRRVRPA